MTVVLWYNTSSMWSRLWDWLFPPQCLLCRQMGAYLCSSCKTSLHVHPEICLYSHKYSSWGETHLDERNNSDHHLAGCIIAFRYDTAVRKLISSFKYYHRHHLTDFLAQQLVYHIQSHEHIDLYSDAGHIAITRVPSHRWRRYVVKWYNQSLLLAHAVADQLWLPCIDVVRKIKHTQSQARLSRAKRLVNLQWAFHIQDRDMSDIQTLIIVDDVTTTGSTLNILAGVIKQSYPHLSVRWAVLARNG